MTIQIKDKILFNTNEIKGSLEILKGSESLLKLEGYDDYCEDRVLSSCYKGYIAQYEIIDNKLILQELQLNSEYDISIISNNSIKVTQSTLDNYTFKQHNISNTPEKYLLFDEKYTNINLNINYTGKLLVGYRKNHSSILTSQDNMSYWSNKYKHLIELHLSSGIFINSRVLSEEEIDSIIKEEKNNINKMLNHIKSLTLKSKNILKLNKAK